MLGLFILTTASCSLSTDPTTLEPLPSREAATSTSQAANTETAAVSTNAPPATSTSPPELSSATILVDSFEQEIYPFILDGDCSLGEAITAANTAAPLDGCAAGDPAGIVGGPAVTVIQLKPGTYTLTMPDQSPLPEILQGIDWGPSGLPPIKASVTIQGNGALIERQGSASFRLLLVFLPDFEHRPQVTLTDLTLVGGDAGKYVGGGLHVYLASLELNNVSVTGNKAGYGGGIYSSSSTLTIVNSIVADNTAGPPGIGSGGGIYSSDSTVQISHTQITGNTSESDYGGGINNAAGTMTITESLLAYNTAALGGGLVNPVNPVDGSTLISGSCIIGNISTYSSHPGRGSGVFGAADARNNWWGDASGPGDVGPGLGDQITADVIYEPFLTELPEFCSIAAP